MPLWNPSNLSTPPTCWLKADSLALNDGDAISSWPDSSGNSHDATGSGATRPIFKTGILNSLPVVRLDGTKRMLVTNLGDALSADDTYTVFILSHPNAVTNYPIVLTWPANTAWNWILEYDTGGGFYWGQQSPSYRLYATATAGGDIDLLALTRTSASAGTFYKNGTQITSFTTNGSGFIASPSMAGDMMLGNYPPDGSFGFNGDIAEIVICNTSLSDSDRQLVEGYLAWKWGRQASLPGGHPYKSAAPTISVDSSMMMSAA